MRKIKMYIAISLDGKIADAEGGVDWLEQVPNPDQSDYGYAEFLSNVDTTIMGNSTYQQVLSFPIPFPYTDKKNYVFTRNQSLTYDEHATFISSGFESFLNELKQQEGKDIWLIGGGGVNTLIHNLDLIDEYLVFMMPVVLGAGIPLFSENPATKSLKLMKSETYESGVTLLHYKNG